MYRTRTGQGGGGSRAGELTRQDVIDAAAGLVAEYGYAGLTMRALARRCGVPTMTLYRHVRDKEDLLGALADRVLGELALSAAPGNPARCRRRWSGCRSMMSRTSAGSAACSCRATPTGTSGEGSS
jgi:AcrR family transcriptional regulator